MAKTTPSLLDAINAKVTSRGPRCSVKLLDLSPADRRDLDTAIANLAIPCSAIAKALQDRGHGVSSTSLQRHRRGECNCAR